MEERTLESAKQEFREWLYNFRNVKPDSLDEEMESEIEIMADKILDGTLEINEDGTVTFNLAFPLGKNADIKSIKFKSRIRAGAAAKATRKSDSAIDRNNALIGVATDTMKAIIDDMDTSDQALAAKFVGFYYLY